MLLGQLSVKAAVTVKDTVQKKLDEERKKQSPPSSPSSPSDVKNIEEFGDTLNAIKQKEGKPVNANMNIRSEHYISDDETLSYNDR
jgi:hypothetical protein